MTSSEDAPDGEWVDCKEVRTPEARRVADLASVGDDLSFVMRAAERLLTEMAHPESERDPVVIRALWSSALVAYKRCFTDGKRAALAPSDVQELGLEGDVLGWHQFLLAMRDKHIAHSVNPFEDVRVGVFLAPDGAVLGSGHMLLKHMVTTEDGVRQLGWLARDLLALVSDRYNGALEVLSNQAAEMSPSEKAKLPRLTSTAPEPGEATKPRRHE